LVMNTSKGRGVFAAIDIPARTILEVCPVLVLDPVENAEHISRTELFHYTYNWPYTPPTKAESTSLSNGTPKSPITTQAVIFGLGSMFNHSNLRQNVGWQRDLQNLLVTYLSLRDIKAGEELCISYGPRLTFKDTEAAELDHCPEDPIAVLNAIDLID